jgi:hypothetical protein
VNEVKSSESSLTAPPERADEIFLEGPRSRFDEFITLLILNTMCCVLFAKPRPEARCPPNAPFG